jgi:hypothetical protein|tara:strand:+ start:167 stop:400 length:234 start_codon:yes stop_codon:yes gene_type:complete
MFDAGSTVMLKAASGASQRTRNRIRERGADGFTVERAPQPIAAPNNRGVNWVLLMSLDGKWSGWLPVDEIEVVNESR